MKNLLNTIKRELRIAYYRLIGRAIRVDLVPLPIKRLGLDGIARIDGGEWRQVHITLPAIAMYGNSSEKAVIAIMTDYRGTKYHYVRYVRDTATAKDAVSTVLEKLQSKEKKNVTTS